MNTPCIFVVISITPNLFYHSIERSKMNLPKVSIIIPVYNAGCYFEKCLDSLINQTLKEIEIILVIDCPTDGSDKIAEFYYSIDNRIKLIYNEENLHTGLSRNRGMNIARGKYIGFHDHDDYCEPNMYELLYQKAEQEKLDVVRCNFSCIYTNKTDTESKIEKYNYPSTPTHTSNKEWIYENVSNGNISCVIWNHIYNTDFLRHHSIIFLDSRSICSEDSLFFLEVYHSNTHKVGIVPEYLYYHIFHATNTGKIYDYRSIKNRISFFEELYAFLRQNEIGENKCLTFLSEHVIKSLYTGSRQALLLFPLKRAIAEIRHIKKSRLIKKCINFLYKKENSSILLHLKPTIIAFSLILKLSTKK